jgi:hypothetical protein
VSRTRPGNLVAHCSVRDDAGAVVERVRISAPVGAPAFVLLSAVLRLALAERRRGRGVRVDAPADLVALLRLCGLSDGAGEIRP